MAHMPPNNKKSQANFSAFWLQKIVNLCFYNPLSPHSRLYFSIPIHTKCSSTVIAWYFFFAKMENFIVRNWILNVPVRTEIQLVSAWNGRKQALIMIYHQVLIKVMMHNYRWNARFIQKLCCSKLSALVFWMSFFQVVTFHGI